MSHIYQQVVEGMGGSNTYQLVKILYWKPSGTNKQLLFFRSKSSLV